MVDPHVCADGHSYEHDAISAWLERHDTSPQTNLPLAHKHLVPNITLRNAIIAFQSRAEVPAPVAPEPAPAPQLSSVNLMSIQLICFHLKLMSVASACNSDYAELPLGRLCASALLLL